MAPSSVMNCTHCNILLTIQLILTCQRINRKEEMKLFSHTAVLATMIYKRTEDLLAAIPLVQNGIAECNVMTRHDQTCQSFLILVTKFLGMKSNLLCKTFICQLKCFIHICTLYYYCTKITHSNQNSPIHSLLQQAHNSPYW